MNKFDSIRPYEDSEVEAVLSSLCSNVNVIRALIDSSDSSLISLLPFKEKIISLYLKHKTKNISSIIEYQNLFESIVSNVVNQSINSLSVSGFENLDKNSAARNLIQKRTGGGNCPASYQLGLTVAMNESLCLKYASAQISLFFTSYE